jgi:cyclophilin family peptidyl-prolyl cis-trans isomerase
MPAAASFAAVNNFVFLADYQYYNGTFFHRVVPGFAVQGGDPTGLGTGGAVVGGKSGEAKYGFPGYEFTGNTPPASCATKPSQAACYQPYDLVMANTGHATSDGSQFFFVLPGGQTQLSPLYTIFGKVTSGTSVVDRIGALGGPAPTGTPKVKIYLLSVTVKQISG